MDADDLHVLAVVLITGFALITLLAGDVCFGGNTVARCKAADVFADRDDVAREFMAEHHRHGDSRLRPFVPFIDVLVCAADCCHADAHQQVIFPDLRDREILPVFCAGGRSGFDDSFHSFLHICRSFTSWF